MGIGVALPRHELAQTDAFELAREVFCDTPEQAKLLKVLYRRSGVNTRYSVVPLSEAVALRRRAEESRAEDSPAYCGPSTAERMRLYQEHSLPLATRAARQALDQSGLAPRDVTHVVTVSCTGFAAPGVDVGLIRALELAPTVERSHIGFMGCHGAINGLRVAQALAGSQPQARILLCAVELCSLHCHFPFDPSRSVGNAIFADGAAALVGGAAAPKSDAWRVAATSSCLLQDTQDAMSWDIGDHGFLMELSSRVPDLIQRDLRGWLEAWLAQHDLRLEDVASWAVHPGGPRIVTAVQESLGLSAEAVAVSREVLSEFGNMSSPTVLFILERFLQGRGERPCVMLAFGPGLVAEAVLWR